MYRTVFVSLAACFLLGSAAFAQKAKMSVGELDDGNCSVHFRVTHADKTPIAGAWVQARVKTASGHNDVVAIHTNDAGTAQFLGLPDSGTLVFQIKDAGKKKDLAYPASQVCGSVATSSWTRLAAQPNHESHLSG